VGAAWTSSPSNRMSAKCQKRTLRLMRSRVVSLSGRRFSLGTLRIKIGDLRRLGIGDNLGVIEGELFGPPVLDPRRFSGIPQSYLCVPDTARP
jgi:hypothetical protein